MKHPWSQFFLNISPATRAGGMLVSHKILTSLANIDLGFKISWPGFNISYMGVNILYLGANILYLSP